MGKFKPTKLGMTIIIIALAIVVVLGLSTIDTGLALNIPPPELRVVGGCFRDCIDPEQTGFGMQDPVPEDIPVDIIIIDDEGNETIVDGIVDGITGVVTIIDDMGNETPIGEPDPTNMCSPSQELINGVCNDIEVVLPNGEVHSLLEIDDTVACWVNVHADVIIKGNLIDQEQSSFFKTQPVPQLSLTDLPTELEFVENDGYRIFPMLKCATNEQGGIDPESAFGGFSFIFPSFDTPLRLQSGELVARVYSQSPDGHLVDTFNFPIQIDSQQITTANAITLGELLIPTERIFIFIPKGQYDSEQQIVLEGNIVLHWATGIQSVDNVPLVIRLQTIKTEDGEGNIRSIVNPVTIFRDLRVDKGVIDVTEEKPECESGEFAIGDSCQPVTDNCPQGFFLIQNQCQPLGTDTSNPEFAPQNIVDRFLICIGSGSTDCLFSTEFFPFFLIGIVLLIMLGAGIALARKEPDIYGVPRGNF